MLREANIVCIKHGTIMDIDCGTISILQFNSINHFIVIRHDRTHTYTREI